MLFDQVFPEPAAKMEEEEPIIKTWLSKGCRVFDRKGKHLVCIKNEAAGSGRHGIKKQHVKLREGQTRLYKKRDCEEDTRYVSATKI